MKHYPIHERFYTFQGEGVHAGKPAFFIRTYGCPVKCPWCDSAGTWHKDYVPDHVEKMTGPQLALEVEAAGADMVVITGGEPTVMDLSDLTKALRVIPGIQINLETSGAFPIKGSFDWITLSPKVWKKPLAENVKQANEFKIIVEDPADIEFYTLMLTELGYQHGWIWLHPEWSKRNDPEVLKAIVDKVKMKDLASTRRYLYRAGWQMHKLYRADSFDKRTQPLVPLGGDINRGF